LPCLSNHPLNPRIAIFRFYRLMNQDN
jgi:hypothetical protein